MGSNSTGPLVVTTRAENAAGIRLYDPKTLKESEYTFEGRQTGRLGPEYVPEVRVSADGDVITGWVLGLQPSGAYIWARDGKTYKEFHEHDTWGPLMPDPDGLAVYAAGRAITPGGKPFPDAPAGRPVPAVHGPLVLSLELGNPRGGVLGHRRPVRATLRTGPAGRCWRCPSRSGWTPRTTSPGAISTSSTGGCSWSPARNSW